MSGPFDSFRLTSGSFIEDENLGPVRGEPLLHIVSEPIDGGQIAGQNEDEGGRFVERERVGGAGVHRHPADFDQWLRGLETGLDEARPPPGHGDDDVHR
jgi:hypothetical protein